MANERRSLAELAAAPVVQKPYTREVVEAALGQAAGSDTRREDYLVLRRRQRLHDLLERRQRLAARGCAFSAG